MLSSSASSRSESQAFDFMHLYSAADRRSWLRYASACSAHPPKRLTTLPYLPRSRSFRCVGCLVL